ncbi:hypothetical protein ILUMI_23491 [Ignelater luminosus]|uniref:DDE-1 domain-containing protein n=1 Tax=Ignelater luminosus TaxID=2038154 RepID=A0A8K0G1V2_IGNLU|nr:hypothetical protein ILUMI_23491 [Ignelater luminosus]
MTSFGAKPVLENEYMPTSKVQRQVSHLNGSLLPAPQQEARFVQTYFVGENERKANLRFGNYDDPCCENFKAVIMLTKKQLNIIEVAAMIQQRKISTLVMVRAKIYRGWLIISDWTLRQNSSYRYVARVGGEAKLFGKVQVILVHWLKNAYKFRNRIEIHHYVRRRWYNLFLKKNSQLAQRTVENILKGRAVITKESIQKWFATLHECLKQQGVEDILDDPTRILNGDETSFVFCPNTGKVIAPRGYKNVYQTQKRKEKAITVLMFFSASGEILPPCAVFPFVRPPKDVILSMPGDWFLEKSDSGWMKSDIFFDYIVKGLDNWLLQKNIEKPVLVFVDGHKKNCAVNVNTVLSVIEKQKLMLNESVLTIKFYNDTVNKLSSSITIKDNDKDSQYMNNSVVPVQENSDENKENINHGMQTLPNVLIHSTNTISSILTDNLNTLSPIQKTSTSNRSINRIEAISSKEWCEFETKKEEAKQQKQHACGNWEQIPAPNLLLPREAARGVEASRQPSCMKVWLWHGTSRTLSAKLASLLLN